MKSKLLILFTVFALVFAACTDPGSPENPQSGFNGGDDALVFEFVDNAPPNKVRDQSLQPFTVRLKIENKGEHTIEANTAYVNLAGFEPSSLGLTSTSKTLPLIRGVKQQGSNVIPGGQHQVVYDQMKYVNNIFANTAPLTIFANVCYPYKTTATAQVCINGDTVIGIDDSAEICEIEGSKSSSNSGSPVQIQNFEQFASGTSSIQIQFEIVHKPTSSSAEVFAPGTIDSNCNINGNNPSSNAAFAERDKVTYTVNTGIPGLVCNTNDGTNTETVQLIDDRYTVICTQDTSGQPEFEKPISITLDFDYWDRISKTITIEHIDR